MLLDSDYYKALVSRTLEPKHITFCSKEEMKEALNLYFDAFYNDEIVEYKGVSLYAEEILRELAYALNLEIQEPKCDLGSTDLEIYHATSEYANCLLEAVSKAIYKKEETRKAEEKENPMTNKTNEVLNTVENATTKPATTKATKRAETKTVRLTKKELKAIARNEKKAEAAKKEITREQLGLYPTKAFKATRHELIDLLAATRLLEAKRQARDNAPKGSTEREHAKAEFEAAQKVRNEKFKTATFTIAAEQEIERFMEFVLYGTPEERINSGMNLLEALGLRVNGAENQGKAILLLTRAVPMKRANWNTMSKTGKIAGLAQKEFHKMLVDLVVYVALENEQK